MQHPPIDAAVRADVYAGFGAVLGIASLFFGMAAVWFLVPIARQLLDGPFPWAITVAGTLLFMALGIWLIRVTRRHQRRALWMLAHVDPTPMYIGLTTAPRPKLGVLHAYLWPAGAEAGDHWTAGYRVTKPRWNWYDVTGCPGESTVLLPVWVYHDPQRREYPVLQMEMGLLMAVEMLFSTGDAVQTRA